MNLTVREVEEGGDLTQPDKLLARVDFPRDFGESMKYVLPDGCVLMASRESTGVVKMTFHDIDVVWADGYKETYTKVVCEEPVSIVSTFGPLKHSRPGERKGVTYWTSTFRGTIDAGQPLPRDFTPVDVAFTVEIWMKE